MITKNLALSLLAISMLIHLPVSAQICDKNLMVNFEFNQAELKASETAKLDSLITLVSNTKEAYLEIYGHTDAKGTNEYNYQLANDRIKAVKTYITEKTKGKTLSVKEYNFGEDRPLYEEAVKNLESKNRRVELSFFALDNGRIIFKKDWATFSIPKEYFASCGVCGSHPRIDEFRTTAAGQPGNLRMRDSIGRQLASIGGAKFSIFCPEQKGKCPEGVVRLPASEDKEMSFYVSSGEGVKMFQRLGKPGAMKYDTNTKEYVIQVDNICNTWFSVDKPVDSIVIHTPILQRTTKMKAWTTGKTELTTVSEAADKYVAACYGCGDKISFKDSGLAKNGYVYYFDGSIKKFAHRRNSFVNHQLDLYSYQPVVSYTDSVMVVMLPGKLTKGIKLYLPDIDSLIKVKRYEGNERMFTFKKPAHPYVLVSKKSKSENYEMSDELLMQLGTYIEEEKQTIVSLKKKDAKVVVVPKKKKKK